MNVFPITVETVRAGEHSVRFQRLYECAFSSVGSQMCRFIGYKGDGFLVLKWRARSKRWTQPVVVEALREL